jgi:hypothetical protein
MLGSAEISWSATAWGTPNSEKRSAISIAPKTRDADGPNGAAEGHVQRVDAVRDHLRSASRTWAGMSREERRTYVQNLLAPLRISPDLRRRLTLTAAVVAHLD